MENYLLSAFAAFAGAFAANVFTRYVYDVVLHSPAPPRARASRGFVLTAALIFAMVAATVFAQVSSGNMAPALGGIILLVTIGTLGFTSRAFRKPPTV